MNNFAYTENLFLRQKEGKLNAEKLLILRLLCHSLCPIRLYFHKRDTNIELDQQEKYVKHASAPHGGLHGQLEFTGVIFNGSY